MRLFREGGWDPGWYEYPQLPIVAVTAAWRLYAPVYRAMHGTRLVDQLPARVELYDDLEPFDLLLIARGLNLAIGVAVVVLTGLLARRIGGEAAGVSAALLAAVTPALVLRGSIASIDGYAVLTVLACLYLTDCTRTSSRPGLLCALAGAAAGLSFASKYPAVAVVAAVVVTTLLQPIRWREKARRLALTAAGLLLGVALGMPASIGQTQKVADAIRHQAAAYREMTSPPLWRQALVRAEWDLRYEKPELGLTFLALAACGLAVGLRDRRISATVWGWCAFAAIALALYGTRRYQPFRNLVPLVPPACVAVGLLIARLRERLRRPVLIGAVFAGWLLVSLAIPLAAYGRDRAHRKDTRVEAVDWLVGNAGRGDDVLFLRDLGFRTSEIARVPARASVRRWEEFETAAERDRPRYIVASTVWMPGVGPIDALASPRLSRLYDVAFPSGDQSGLRAMDLRRQRIHRLRDGTKGGSAFAVALSPGKRPRLRLDGKAEPHCCGSLRKIQREKHQLVRLRLEIQSARDVPEIGSAEPADIEHSRELRRKGAIRQHPGDGLQSVFRLLGVDSFARERRADLGLGEIRCEDAVETADAAPNLGGSRLIQGHREDGGTVHVGPAQSRDSRKRLSAPGFRAIRGMALLGERAGMTFPSFSNRARRSFNPSRPGSTGVTSATSWPW